MNYEKSTKYLIYGLNYEIIDGYDNFLPNIWISDRQPYIC